MVIEALPRDTVRLITSTQVITSPSSIVKELIENAIDAAATTVSIRLESYGFSFLEVRDNGSGIEKDDVNFVAKPHFTSKIQAFADLASLTTYGFRGEALASLCSVAEVSITTKTKKSVVGHTYTLDNSGSVSAMKPAAAPNGTTVMCRNLFKRLPVRRQYFSSTKRRKEELKKVEDLVFAFSLAAPKVHLTLTHDKCVLIQKSSVKNIQEALMSTFPAVYRDLVFKEKRIEDIIIEAYLPDSGPCDNPNLSRTTPDRLFILVNHRPVIHKSVEKLIKAYYSHKSEGSHGRYPLGIVALRLPPAAMDINLEPNKTKILLNDEKQILEAMQEILSELYGSLDLSKKCDAVDSSDPNCSADITCTFGGLGIESDLGQQNRKEVQNSEASDFTYENDGRHSLISSEKIWSSTHQRTVKSGIGGKSGSSKLAARFGRTQDEDFTKRPTQVQQEGNEQRQTDCSIKGTTCNISELEAYDNNTKKKDEYQGKNKAIHTSTPNSVDGHFPSIPGSSILPDDYADFVNVNDLSVLRSLEDMSDITPLAFSYDSVLPDGGSGYNQHIKKPHEGTVPIANQDTSKLHESFTGSDGIPVYKIPPLLCIADAVQHFENDENNSIVQGNQIKDGESNKNNTEKTDTDVKDVCFGKPPDIEERDKHTAGSWSKGLPINGKNIQTVQLVTTAARVSKLPVLNSVHGDDGKTAKRQAPPECGRSAATPTKKTRINSLGPCGFDYIYGKLVQKPSSPFILFSREIRSQVLSEHPGADFAFVAKEMADRWKALAKEKKNHYTELAKAEVEKYQMEVRQIRETRGLDGSSPLGKRCKTGASLDRFLAPITPYIGKCKAKIIHKQQPLVSHKPWLQHSKDIECSLEKIKNKIKMRNSKKSNAGDLMMLGCVTSNGGWVCVQGSDIMALNIYRVCEIVLCNTLMKTFALSLKPLDEAIVFNSSSLGLENWTALLKLTRELVPHENFYCVTDQRLIANGLNIILFPGTTSSVAISHGEISEITDAVGFYGISDLKEILSILVTSPHATLEQARPLKIRQWLKAEAVRMGGSQPNILKQEEVLDKIKNLQLMQGAKEVTQQLTEQTCIHGKPICTKLYSLEDTPMSQTEANLKYGD